MTRSPQLELKFPRRGGKREGAGRPPNGSAAGVSHLRRPTLSRHHPLHVTLRAVAHLPSLRAGELFPAVQKALAGGRERFGFRLVHFSVQSNHLHLIVETEGGTSLSRGVQGLCVRLARAVNRRLQRKGRLFADRYHARALRTPRAVHFALRYVLLNARKHARAPQFPGGAPGRARALLNNAVPAGFVDSCSSAAWFDGFDRPRALAFGAERVRERWRARSPLEAPVVPAQTWLLRRGSRRYRFDVDDELAVAAR